MHGKWGSLVHSREPDDSLAVSRIAVFEKPQQSLVLEDSDVLPDDCLRLLLATDWGTRGLRYRMEDVSDVVARLPNAHYLTLRQRGRAIATLTLVPHTFCIEGVPVRALFRCLLAVDGEFQGQGFGTLIAEHVRRTFLDQSREPTLLYGFIESDNHRSRRVQERTGYEPFGEFQFTNFGYLRPRASPGVAGLAAHEVVSLRQELQTFYADHTFCEFGDSLVQREYWVLREGSQIIAGAQVVPRQLSVRDLAGVSGQFLRLASPVLQQVTPFFRLEHRRFLWFGNLFFRGDDARPLMRLLESVLAQFGVAAGGLYSDLRSSRFVALQRAGLGLLHQMSPQQKLTVFVGHRNVPEPVLARIRRGPIVYSPLDCT